MLMEVSTYKKPVKVVVETDTQTNEKSLGKKKYILADRKTQKRQKKTNRHTNIKHNNFWGIIFDKNLNETMVIETEEHESKKKYIFIYIDKLKVDK